MSKLASYELVERIGAGGMGEVYLARQVGIAGFRRRVAIKRLLRAAASDEVVERFIDEARIAASLVHPGIVAIHEFGRDDDGFFIVMEYVDGTSLARIAERPIERTLAVHVVAEIARAADYAHRARDADGNPLRVVHRDISPHNVLVSRTGAVKLTDFGIAHSEDKLSRTQTGTVFGKVGYMAPEQLAGEKVDARADVFAIGVVLWELTLGRPPFAGAALAMRSRELTPVPAPATIDPAYPAALAAIVTRAVAEAPDDRFQTAGELAAALEGYLDQLGVRVREEQIASLMPAAPAAPIGDITTDVATSNERPPRIDALPIGAVVGDYEITGPLGEGAMGVVYAAIDRRIGKRAAIKVLRARHLSDPRAVERFLDEARAVNRIGHPNIVDVFGFGELPGGGVYCVMEQLTGESLRALFAREAPLSRARVIELLRPVAAAIDAAHAAGVVHRDLKPDNIFVGATVKVLDFGIAKLVDAGEPTTAIGTPLYMAPEQARGEGDHRVDVYAFGVILCQALTGELPRSARDVDPAVVRCLAEAPGDRFDSLGAALDALSRPRRWPVVVAGSALAAIAATTWIAVAGETPAAATPDASPAVAVDAMPSEVEPEASIDAAIDAAVDAATPDARPPRSIVVRVLRAPEYRDDLSRVQKQFSVAAPALRECLVLRGTPAHVTVQFRFKASTGKAAGIETTNPDVRDLPAFACFEAAAKNVRLGPGAPWSFANNEDANAMVTVEFDR